MRIDGVVVARVKDTNDFERFVKELNVRGEGFIIKPNWSNAYTYTSARMLDFLFSCLGGGKTVIEGYTAWRNELNTGPEPQDFITPENAKEKWNWIKEQDQWFLKHSGIERVLARYGVEYINITEEVWSGRAVASEEIKRAVEEKFGPVKNEEMYGFVPEKVYSLKGRTLISFNLSRRTRELMSLSTKNMFGLIPDPARYGRWHGKKDALLPQSIVDINTIYRSLFKPCFWINEIKDQGLLVGSENSVEADASVAGIMRIDPEEIGYLRLASEVFGGYDENVLFKVLKTLESLWK